MTKQQTIDYLKKQIERLNISIEEKDNTIDDLNLKLHSLPCDIEEEHYQNFKNSDLAKHIERFVEELIKKNLKIDGNEDMQYYGEYDSILKYKDEIISSFSGQIYTGSNSLDD